MARLVSNLGQPDARSFELVPGVNRIGRKEGFEIQLDDRRLSRVHARIEVTDGAYVITDADSRNGTYVNDERVLVPRPLVFGDEIRLGEVKFEFQDDPEPISVASLPWESNSLSHDSIDDLLTTASREERALFIGVLGNTILLQSKLKILLRVSEVLSSPGEIDLLLARILDLLFQILDVDRGVLLLADPGTSELRPRVQRVREGVPKGPRLYSQTIVNHIRDQGVPTLFANSQDDSRLPPTRSIVSQDIHASMGAPLRARGRTFGVVYVDNLSTPNRFTAEDLEFLGAFANQAAIAIDNAALYKRIESEALLRSNLSRFFPPAALARISQLTDLEVTEAEVTALFCDISDFTGLASRMRPRDVLEMLNVYFPTMARAVFAHEGTLEKYIGDALLAVWGAPTPYADHADRALAAAIDMQHTVARVNQTLGSRGIQIAVHIGLHSGMVAAGNIGSDAYLQYATIGDTTNVTNRVANEAGPGEVVISAATARRLTPGRWGLAPMGSRPLRGKDAPMELWRVKLPPRDPGTTG